MSNYPHIDRIGNLTDKELDSLFIGDTLFIQPKIDGTFGRVELEDDDIAIKSKKTTLSKHSTNQGFYNYINDNKKYHEFFDEYPSLVLLGEWLVPHSIKFYKDTAWRKYYIFDVYNKLENKYLSPVQWAEIIKPYEFDRVTSAIFNIKKLLLKYTVEDLKKEAYILAGKTFLLPKEKVNQHEGVVLKNFITGMRAKSINELYVNERRRVHVPKEKKLDVEFKIAHRLIDIHTVNKRHAELVNLELPKGKLIPRLIESVYHDLVCDDIWLILRKFKSPTIDFRRLRKEVANKIRTLKPEVF
jgi:hypothetical protein